MSKEAYYFSHDSNARHDPKIQAMRDEFGVGGYGAYWIIVEMLREAEDHRLPLKNYIWSAIAMQMQCKDYTKDNAKSFVEFCINECELFQADDDFFWSNSLLKRMEKKSNVSEKRKAAAEARWNKVNNDKGFPGDVNADAMQTDANAMQSDAIKGKESKEKEIKEKEINILNAFESFWSVYPRKLDKKKALEKFKSAAKIHDPQMIITGAQNYARECEIKRTEKQYIKHATTFLNAESFKNEFDLQPTQQRGQSNGKNNTAIPLDEEYSNLGF